MSWTFSLTTPWAITTAVLTPVLKPKGEVIQGAALLDERALALFIPVSEYPR
jgi:hypothetical protein